MTLKQTVKKAKVTAPPGATEEAQRLLTGWLLMEYKKRKGLENTNPHIPR